MTTYKAYPTQKDTPKRMNRKRARTEIFHYNKKEAKKEAKKQREEEKKEREEREGKQNTQ